jgi:tRNA (adenine22-N1)-methyltransferase
MSLSSRLSPRLQKIADMVKHPTLLDVGSDHAYLPIYLLKMGRISFALATDIAKGPLGRGRLNADKAGFGDKIDFLLADGLSGIEAGAYETCVIAGMGGENIISILRDNPKAAKNFKQLILSPQRNAPDVRRFLHEEGYEINDEAMVADGGKFYNILECVADMRTRNARPYSQTDYTFGQILIEQKSPVLKEYLQKEIKKIQNISQQQEYLKLCKDVLECL